MSESTYNTEELRKQVFTAIEDTFKHTLEIKYDEDIDSCTDDIMQLITSRDKAIREEAERESLEGLLDWQDQEYDIDNRPVGEAYYVIQGDARESIEMLLHSTNANPLEPKEDI